MRPIPICFDFLWLFLIGKISKRIVKNLGYDFDDLRTMKGIRIRMSLLDSIYSNCHFTREIFGIEFVNHHSMVNGDVQYICIRSWNPPNITMHFRHIILSKLFRWCTVHYTHEWLHYTERWWWRRRWLLLLLWFNCIHCQTYGRTFALSDIFFSFSFSFFSLRILLWDFLILVKIQEKLVHDKSANEKRKQKIKNDTRKALAAGFWRIFIPFGVRTHQTEIAQ